MLSSEQTSTAKRNTVVISDIFRLPKISTAFDSKRIAFIAKPAVSKDERSRRRMPLCASAKNDAAVMHKNTITPAAPMMMSRSGCSSKSPR